MSRDSPKILIVLPGGLTNLLNHGANARSQIKLTKTAQCPCLLLLSYFIPDIYQTISILSYAYFLDHNVKRLGYIKKKKDGKKRFVLAPAVA